VHALKTPEESSPKVLSVSIALKSYPTRDEKGSGLGRREKTVSARLETNKNMATPVLLKFFSVQTHNSSLPGELTT
jgi:hypothetical protein